MGCLAKTPLVHEDQRLTHFAKRLQERINAALCGGGDTLDVKWSNFLFVDQDDPGPSPEADYWTNKFATIQDAVDAAEDNDVIYINPGTYREDLDLSNIADNVTILGSGMETTIIQSETDTGPTITCSPTTTLNGLTFRELTIQNIYNNPCVLVDASGALGSFGATKPLSFDRVRTNAIITQGGEIMLNYINSAKINNSFVTASGVSFYNSNVTCRNCDIDGTGDTTWLLSDDVPSLGRDGVYFYGCFIHGGDPFYINDQSYVYFDEACVVEDLAGALEQVGVGADNAPYVSFHGSVSSVNMTYEDDEESGSLLIGDFDDAVIANDFIFNSTDDNVNPWECRAQNAVFHGAIQCCANTTATGRASFDMLGAEFQQSALHVNNYAVDRTLHYIPAIGLTEDVTNTIDIEPPYIHDDANYSVHPELVSDGANWPAIAIVGGSKNVGDFGVTCGPAAVSAAFRLIMQRQI